MWREGGGGKGERRAEAGTLHQGGQRKKNARDEFGDRNVNLNWSLHFVPLRLAFFFSFSFL